MALPRKLKRAPSKSKSYTPSGTLWPSGEWSLGYLCTPGDDAQRFSHLADNPEGWFVGEGALDSDPGLPPSEGAEPLNLSNLRNSRKVDSGPATGKPNRPKTYGRKGITGYGRKMVRSLGAMINREYPSYRVTFCTITMPALAPQQRRELALEWPVMVNRLLEWLTRRLKRQSVPELIVSVTEVQPKRLQGTGEGYLHLHLLWLNKPGRKGGWAVDVLNLRAWMAEFLQRRGLWEQDSHVNVNVRPVNGDAAAYLSKYLSKGGDVIAEFAQDNGWDAVPGQWWNMTKVARDWVKAAVHKGRVVGELLDCLLQHFWDSPSEDVFWYVYPVEMEVDGRLLNVGWRGAVFESVRVSLCDMLESA